MKNHTKSVQIACEQAKKSAHSKFHHGCVLIKNGKVISTGYNRDSFRGRPSEHAEESALRNVRDKDARGATMVVIRLKADNSFGNILPCNRCMRIICKRGVYRIFYSHNATERCFAADMDAIFQKPCVEAAN
jgi:pyrimidine deaminase RibD-like protein